VFLDRKRVKVAGRIVRAGQVIEVNLGDFAPMTTGREESVLVPVVHQTDDYVVIDKPSGLFSAPTPESDRNDVLAFLRQQLGTADAPRSITDLHLVHRLDRPTSGLMVIAKTSTAAAHLSAQMASREMTRRYAAILCGQIEAQVEVDQFIEDRPAQTVFTLVEQRARACLVEAELRTGRTHQVRIHANHLHAPVAGDSKYGRSRARLLDVRAPRLCLHASQLRFVDPKNGTQQVFHSPLPEELAKWFHSLPAA
jgi:23S rRNA pseudouridine1911/1915/1917 synthase